MTDWRKVLERARAAPPNVAAVHMVVAQVAPFGGNVLWDGIEVTAALDWPIAARASRWWDEAYAHMDTWLAHGETPASRFRTEYRRIVGRAPDPVRQRFWDLTALVRALPSPGRWLDACRHAGTTTLTLQTLEERYSEMDARVL